MLSPRYLVPLLLVAACGGSRTQLDVIVDTSELPEVDEVRVYLGKNQPSDLDISLAKLDADMNGRRKGRYFLMDKPDAHDRISVSPGDVVTFVYTPPDDMENIDTLAVIAVGFKNGVPNSFARSLGVTFVKDRVLEDELVLKKANKGADYDDDTATRQVVVWRPEDRDDDCVQTLDTSDRTPSVFIIRSKQDKDCDGLVYDDNDPQTRECNETSYLDTGHSRPNDVSCVTEAIPSADCHVGTPKCEDGVPRDPSTCGKNGADYFCTSTDTCTACRSAAGQLGWPCVPQNVVHPAMCEVPILVDNAQNHTVCLPIDVELDTPTVAAVSCDEDHYIGAYNEMSSGGRWQATYEKNNVRMTFTRHPNCSATIHLEQIDPAQKITTSTVLDLWAMLPMNVENRPEILGVVGAMHISFYETDDTDVCESSIDCTLDDLAQASIESCLGVVF